MNSPCLFALSSATNSIASSSPYRLMNAPLRCPAPSIATFPRVRAKPATVRMRSRYARELADEPVGAVELFGQLGGRGSGSGYGRAAGFTIATSKSSCE